jgi:hypothetical protein
MRLPVPLEQADGIGEHCAMEEADTRMRLERVDIAKRRVLHASNRTSIVQELADIGAAVAHALEPCPRHQSVRIGEGKPSLNLRISSDCTRVPQEITHLGRMSVCPASVEPPSRRQQPLSSHACLNGEAHIRSPGKGLLASCPLFAEFQTYASSEMDLDWMPTH